MPGSPEREHKYGAFQEEEPISPQVIALSHRDALLGAKLRALYTGIAGIHVETINPQSPEDLYRWYAKIKLPDLHTFIAEQYPDRPDLHTITNGFISFARQSNPQVWIAETSNEKLLKVYDASNTNIQADDFPTITRLLGNTPLQLRLESLKDLSIPEQLLARKAANGLIQNDNERRTLYKQTLGWPEITERLCTYELSTAELREAYEQFSEEQRDDVIHLLGNAVTKIRNDQDASLYFQRVALLLGKDPFI